MSESRNSETYKWLTENIGDIIVVFLFGSAGIGMIITFMVAVYCQICSRVNEKDEQIVVTRDKEDASTQVQANDTDEDGQMISTIVKCEIEDDVFTQTDIEEEHENKRISKDFSILADQKIKESHSGTPQIILKDNTIGPASPVKFYEFSPMRSSPKPTKEIECTTIRIEDADHFEKFAETEFNFKQIDDIDDSRFNGLKKNNSFRFEYDDSDYRRKRHQFEKQCHSEDIPRQAVLRQYAVRASSEGQHRLLRNESTAFPYRYPSSPSKSRLSPDSSFDEVYLSRSCHMNSPQKPVSPGGPRTYRRHISPQSSYEYCHRKETPPHSQKSHHLLHPDFTPYSSHDEYSPGAHMQIRRHSKSFEEKPLPPRVDSYLQVYSHTRLIESNSMPIYGQQASDLSSEEFYDTDSEHSSSPVRPHPISSPGSQLFLVSGCPRPNPKQLQNSRVVPSLRINQGRIKPQYRHSSASYDYELSSESEKEFPAERRSILQNSQADSGYRSFTKSMSSDRSPERIDPRHSKFVKLEMYPKTCSRKTYRTASKRRRQFASSVTNSRKNLYDYCFD